MEQVAPDAVPFMDTDRKDQKKAQPRALFGGRNVQEEIHQGPATPAQAVAKPQSKWETIGKTIAWGIVFFAVLAVVLFALMQAGVVEVSLKGVGIISTEVALYGVLASGGTLFVMGAVYTVLQIAKQRKETNDLLQIESNNDQADETLVVHQENPDRLSASQTEGKEKKSESDSDD